MRKILLVVGLTQNVLVMLIWCLPPLVIYCLFLGMVTVDVREGPADPYFTIPGWSRDELEWNIPHWAKHMLARYI